MDPVDVSDHAYLELLASVGVTVTLDEWKATHDRPIDLIPDHPGEAVFPLRPVAWTDDHVPCFSRRQYDMVRPEDVGYDCYQIHETTPSDASPVALSYADELELKRHARPVHRYNRLYRLKRTLAFTIGCAGVLPPDPLPTIAVDVLMSRRRIYNHVRKLLRTQYKGTVHASLYYASIPYIIAQLTNRRWKVTTTQFASVLDLATKLHFAFNALVRTGGTARHRFPKMQFVILQLLDRFHIVPPYRVPWARTSIKRRQLASLVSELNSGT